MLTFSQNLMSDCKSTKCELQMNLDKAQVKIHQVREVFCLYTVAINTSEIIKLKVSFLLKC